MPVLDSLRCTVDTLYYSDKKLKNQQMFVKVSSWEPDSCIYNWQCTHKRVGCWMLVWIRFNYFLPESSQNVTHYQQFWSRKGISCYLKLRNSNVETNLVRKVAENVNPQVCNNKQGVLNPSMPKIHAHQSKDISAYSLCFSGAMALLCSGVNSDIIEFIGCCCSNKMLSHLHVHAEPVMKNFSWLMITYGNYSFLLHQEAH